MLNYVLAGTISYLYYPVHTTIVVASYLLLS